MKQLQQKVGTKNQNFQHQIEKKKRIRQNTKKELAKLEIDIVKS